jgi:hypothetical protein
LVLIQKGPPDTLASLFSYNETKMNFSETTKFPRLFASTYWGNFQTSDDNNGQPAPAIVRNRNKFATEHGNLKHRPSYPHYLSKRFGLKHVFFAHETNFWDHVEVYETRTEYLVISSPYGPKDLYAAPEGFEQIPPLYAEHTTTWMARVSKRGQRKSIRDSSPKRK